MTKRKREWRRAKYRCAADFRRRSLEAQRKARKIKREALERAKPPYVPIAICQLCCRVSGEPVTRYRGLNLCRACLCPDYDTTDEATVAGSIVLWYAVSRRQSRQKAAPRPTKKR